MKKIILFCNLISIIPAVANDDLFLSPPSSSKPCLSVQQKEYNDGDEILLSLEATAPLYLTGTVFILRRDAKNNVSISHKIKPITINGRRCLPSLPLLFTGITYTFPPTFQDKKYTNFKDSLVCVSCSYKF